MTHVCHGMMRLVLPEVATWARAAQTRLISTTLVARESYNPYKILGLTQAAKAKDVKAAYHRLAKQCHPNVAGGSDDAFCDLHKAYETVTAYLNDNNVFKCCNITYINSLIMGSRLGHYAEHVSSSGVSQKLLPAQLLKSLSLKPAFYKDPVIKVVHIDDQIGFGVKTLEKISKDSLIKPYVGTVEVVHHTECEAKKYGLTVCGTDTQLMIDAEFAGNETRFCNHSYTPNSAIKPILDEKTGFVQYWLVANKDIQPGEEIVWNYGSNYWRTHHMIPFDKNIRHLYQDKQLTMYSYPEKGQAGLYINDVYINSREILASDYIIVGQKVFVVLAVRQGDMAMPILYLKENQCVKFVSDISVLSQDEQTQVAACFHRMVEKF